MISLYEHRTVASGVIWGVNPFDQWGVELGKSIATDIELELHEPSSSRSTDLQRRRNSSNEVLMERFRFLRDYSQ